MVKIEGVPCISLQDIRGVFGGRIEWKRISRQAVYLVEGRSAAFTLDTSSAVVAGKTMVLEIPVRPWGDLVYVPASLLTTLEFQSLVASQVRWNVERLTLTVDPAPEVSSPRFYSYPKHSRVTVELGPRVEYRVLAHRGDTLTIRFYGGRAREWEKVSIEDGAIVSVEMDPRARSNDFIVTLSSNAGSPEVFLEESPRALVIEVTRDPSLKPAPPSQVKEVPRSTSAPVLRPPDEPRPRSDIDSPYLALSPLRTVVIDAGHGGKDPGGVGPGGTLEKDINLQIALSLAKLLNAEGRFKVVLTRSDDRFLTLQERSSIANKVKADLFVSLHCNAGLKRESNGFEVFFLSEKASDDEAAATARRENAVVELEGFAGKARESVEEVLWSLARNEHMNESAEIAGHVARQVSKRLSVENRGVKQAGFYVLRGTSMPAILVESGFITHRKEEALLTSARFQRKLVDALYAGFLEYEKKKIQSRLSSTDNGGS